MSPHSPALNTADLADLARRTRAAQRVLAQASAEQRTAALAAIAAMLDERAEELQAANQADLDAAQDLEPALVHRLGLPAKKRATLIDGLGSLAQAPDPVGRPLRRTALDEGLQLTQVQSPIGVLLIVFESRPDAVIQIGGLAIRSGNGVILKGGKEAAHTNAALVGCLRDGLTQVGLPADAVQGVTGRAQVRALLDLDHHIDLVIPRGSGAMVRHIQQSTRIPVLGHAEGVCSLYLHADADPTMAAQLAVDGKCDYPAACNATETLLVHREFLPQLGKVYAALRSAGVTLWACPRSLPLMPGAQPARPADGATEYGDLQLAVRVVDSIDEAIDWVHAHGSGHTEALCTPDAGVAEHFLARVDSASVFHNASTRFADGYRYGLGAEVGISTGRIHARGPVGVDGLMTTRWLLRGQGQTVAPYSAGEAQFSWTPMPVD